MPLDHTGKYRMNPNFGRKPSGGLQQSVTKTEPQPGPDGKVGTSGMAGTNPPKVAGQAHIDAGLPQMGEPAEPHHAASHAALTAVHQAHGGGQHVIIHKGDDGSLTSHHIGETGEPEGPEHHEDIQALVDHLKQILEELQQFAQEEQQEPQGVLGGY